MCKGQPASSPAELQRGRAKTSFAYRAQIDVLTSKPVPGDTLYLLRLREDFGSRISYHLKSMTQFREFDARLRAEADPQVFKEILDLPANGRLGLRRQLSKVGFGDFLERQQDGIQQYIEILVHQVPAISADKNLQSFLSGAVTPEGERLINMFLSEARGGLSISSLVGTWRQEDSNRTWSVNDRGEASLLGDTTGHKFDLLERGQGLDRIISSRDGWKVDLEKSTPHHLYWCLPGEADVEWQRVNEHEDFAPARGVAPSCVTAWLGYTKVVRQQELTLS